MKTNLLQISILIGFLALPVIGEENASDSERCPREDSIELIENALKGGVVCIEGRIEMIDNIYYLNSYSQPSRKYRLVLDAPGKTVNHGAYIVTCRIEFDEDRKRIDSLTVIRLIPVPGASQEAIDGLVAEINELNDMAFSDKGSEKLQNNIDKVKIAILAQYHFYARYYPNELSKAKKNEKKIAPKDPFDESMNPRANQ